MRAKHEYKIVSSIQHLVCCRSDIVIHRTDTNKVFYIGKPADFARKEEEYMLETETYQEIIDGCCPLANNLHAVQTILTHLLTQKALMKQQSNRISPKLNNLEGVV
ncbi:unnamed protein product, partial [Rotaria sp. Silwood2]